MLFNTIANHPIVYSNSVLIDEKGNNLNKNLSGIKRLVDFNSCLSYAIGGSVPGHAMLICRELIEKCYPFPEIIPHDYWIGFIASCYGTIKYIDTPLNAYRQHKNNTFGVSTGKNVSVKKKSAKENLNEIRNRMQLLSESCPKDLSEKKIYQQLNATYNSFGVVNNFKRAYLFFTNRKVILAYKKKSDFRKWLFCFKTFFKPQ
jgi:hypothetical protein